MSKKEKNIIDVHYDYVLMMGKYVNTQANTL